MWHTATGKAVTRIKTTFSSSWGPVLGWYDEHQLLAPTDQGFDIVNLKGKVVETLIKVGKNDHFEARARN